MQCAPWRVSGQAVMSSTYCEPIRRVLCAFCGLFIPITQQCVRANDADIYEDATTITTTTKT